MKKFLLICFLVFCIALISGCVGEETVSTTEVPLKEGYIRYSDDVLGFTIDYPEYCELEEAFGGEFLAGKTFDQMTTDDWTRLAVLVYTNESDAKWWLNKDIVDKDIEELKEVGAISKFETVTINGREGVEVIFDPSKIEGMGLPFMTNAFVVVFDVGDYYYVVVGMSSDYDNFNELYENSLNSFVIDEEEIALPARTESIDTPEIEPVPEETLENVSLADRYDADEWKGVAVAGNYAYVADEENGLVILDISDPTSPTLAGSYDTAGLAGHVDVAGNYAYVADFENGLVILDISDPTSPTLASSYDTDTDGMKFNIAVAGNYVYVASNDLVIVDVSDPTSPTLEGSYDGCAAVDVAVAGNYAYVANAADRVVILDISDPTSPALTGSYVIDRSPYGVTVAGNYVYVATNNGFVIVDVSDPTSPTLAGSYDTDDMAVDVTVAGNYAYVANRSNGLVILNISDPTSPTLAGSYDTAGLAGHVDVAGNYAYVIDFENGLFILDISTFR
ncbi:Uncharacterized conserved protein [Methanococcoides vulcani]|uniref:Uncharacterized conserved protein n=1 Tax=Methanococcoides vulcani TaxID=1353158 RepID=A0A1I0B4H5_9EURY|nr:beta-propeller domain-containing protein [Methanococcoides vulcani]SET01770.1 Uncharacterized conserved protein [Methanococcoides vulcani]